MQYLKTLSEQSIVFWHEGRTPPLTLPLKVNRIYNGVKEKRIKRTTGSAWESLEGLPVPERCPRQPHHPLRSGALWGADSHCYCCYWPSSYCPASSVGLALTCRSTLWPKRARTHTRPSYFTCFPIEILHQRSQLVFWETRDTYTRLKGQLSQWRNNRIYKYIQTYIWEIMESFRILCWKSVRVQLCVDTQDFLPWSLWQTNR